MKENQSFQNLEAKLDLQELIGISVRRIFHSTNTCTDTVNCITI
jgi:hypothetical protein